jgi:hypothetical protein
MFAVIYQVYIKLGSEEKFRESWKQIARYFIEKRGALGSCLHRTSEGMWLAYSRWPDKATRDASWPKDDNAPSIELPQEIRQAIITLKACIDEERKIPDILMEVVDDFYA